MYLFSNSQRVLNSFQAHSDQALVDSLQTSLIQIPFCEIIKALWPFLKHEKTREMLIDLALNTARYGRMVMDWPQYLANPRIQEMINLMLFKTPFKFNEVPFALLGHIIISQAHVIDHLSQANKELAMGFRNALGASSIWHLALGYSRMKRSESFTSRRRELMTFSVSRPVNLNALGAFVQKLMCKGEFSNIDLKQLVQLATCVETIVPAV